MDFTNRGAQNSVAPPPAPVHEAVRKHHESTKDESRWYRTIVVSMSALIAILIIGVIVVISTSNAGVNNSYDEAKYINTSKLQAVFLNTGQVYFGNLKVINDKYFVLTNIFYLQTNTSSTSSSTSSSSNNVSLVKLGCELHQPYDEMVINTSEVTFWENLQSTGQVAKAVATFQQENPNGQKCSDQSASSSTTSGNSAQSAGSNSGTSSITPSSSSSSSTNP